MTTSTVATYLQYANLQMAAEAFLTNAAGSTLTDPDSLKGALIKGNDHASRFTDTGATTTKKVRDICFLN